MSVFRNLIAPLASAAGDTILGAKTDRDDALKREMQSKAQQRQSVLDALMARKTEADITESLARATSLENRPITPEDLVVTVGPDGKRVHTPKSQAAGLPAPEPPTPQASYTFPVGADAEGNPIIHRANTRTGDIAPTGVAGKPSAAKPTEQQEKSFLFYRLMEQAEPEIDAAIATGNIRPAAITAYLNSGPADIGVNAFLNPDEQKLVRAGKDFAAGVNRKETGATITHAEMKETLGRFFPGLFGDSPELGEAKTKARKQYMESMRQMAGPAADYYGKRESGQPTREQALWDAAVAKHGEAVVLEKFGPRP